MSNVKVWVFGWAHKCEKETEIEEKEKAGGVLVAVVASREAYECKR